MGIITDAWVKLQKKPKFKATAGYLFSDFLSAAQAVRSISQAGLYPANVRIVDVFSGAFKSNITKKRNDYSKLIDPNEIGALLVSQILNRNSFIQDKIYIKRDIY